MAGPGPSMRPLAELNQLRFPWALSLCGESSQASAAVSPFPDGRLRTEFHRTCELETVDGSGRRVQTCREVQRILRVLANPNREEVVRESQTMTKQLLPAEPAAAPSTSGRHEAPHHLGGVVPADVGHQLDEFFQYAGELEKTLAVEVQRQQLQQHMQMQHQQQQGEQRGGFFAWLFRRRQNCTGGGPNDQPGSTAQVPPCSVPGSSEGLPSCVLEGRTMVV